MKKFIFLILSSILVSCDSMVPSEEQTSKTDVQLVREVRLQAAQKLKAQYNLQPCGSGSQMMHEIKMIALSFNYYSPLTLDEARNLLLASTDELMNAVNNNVDIRQFLGNYPFLPKNIEIRIFLYNPDGSNPPEGSLSVISSINGILDYEIDNSKTGLFTHVLKETYVEAVENQKHHFDASNKY
jgi:hypothetical protein